MSSPPTWLQWIAVAGGAIAILKGLAELIQYWHGRQRIPFHVLSTVTYYEKWTESDFRDFKPTETWPKPFSRVGHFRWLFTVLEFSIENRHPHAVSVGRFLINDWILRRKVR